ncbi:YqiA/YcfP family alpha/beta fold hydrolase [Eionea flava]
MIIDNHYLIDLPLMGISNDIDQILDVVSDQVMAISGKITVIGKSLGGYIALALAERLLEKVEQVLISGSAVFSKIYLDIKGYLSPHKTLELANRLIDTICYDKTVYPTSIGSV